jgi:hypothetical protein
VGGGLADAARGAGDQEDRIWHGAPFEWVGRQAPYPPGSRL